jgi:hypothetical protein
MTDIEFAELRSLLDALCEESISAEQVRRLEELVLSHPDAEAYYVQYMNLYADLSRAKHVKPVREPAQTVKAASPWRRRRMLAWGSVGLTGLVAAGLLLMFGMWPTQAVVSQFSDPQERVDDTVAVLLQAHEAEWEKTDLPTRMGSPLRPGVLRLKSGVAHIEFYSGATVILQGPAEFRLISRTKAFCVRGKLRATVPAQAHGFTIGSPALDLVDLGTEFGMQVDGQDKTEVHVFEGKVELQNTGTERQALVPKELTIGQGVRVEGANMLRPIKANSTAFVTAKELAAQSQKDSERRQLTWATASDALLQEPNLEVYYRFQPERPWDRILQDQSRQRRQPRDGAIVGCSWAAGRWPLKQGLEFKQVSDRVRFHVPGEFQSITLMAWVRVDALPNLNNSLMMADGWEPGGLHWQIGDDGTIILGVQQRPKGRGAHYHAPAAITPDQFGRWLHLAVVYDHEQGFVTHWVNSQKAATVPVQFDIPLRIGDAELGNWNVAKHRNSTPVRYFSGCIDEFMIFSRPLSDKEIERLYLECRPPL